MLLLSTLTAALPCVASANDATPAVSRSEAGIGVDTAQRALPTIKGNVVQPAHYQHVYIDTRDENAGALQTISLQDAVANNVLASSEVQVKSLSKVGSGALSWVVLDKADPRPVDLEGVGGVGIQTNNFSEVNFALNKTEILNPAKLVALVSLASRVHGVFHVVGYTDETGIEAKNYALSEARAKAVTDALISAGVSAQRIKSVGAGVSHVYAGLDANRRTSVTFRVTE